MYAVVGLLLACVIAKGQTLELTKQLGKTVLYKEPAISPDGRFVSWSQTTSEQDRPVLYLHELSAGAPKPVKAGTATARRDSEPSFSPDSKTLAFFSKASDKDQTQLWTLALPSQTAKKRTDLKGFCARLKWSPDGKQIAFLYIEGGEGGGPLLAAPAQTGVIEADIHNQRIAVFDASGNVRMASPPDLHVYDFDWSPDSAHFVFTGAPGPGDNNWWIAKIYVSDSSGAAKPIYEPKWQVAIPRWSPDGRTIGFIEGIMSDEGFHGGDLLTMDPSGSGVINRTRGRRTSVNSLTWVAADTLILTEWVSGGSAITKFSTANGSFTDLWKGGESLHAYGNFPDLALTPDGKASVAVRSDDTTAYEVWTGPPGHWTKLTSGNATQAAHWGKAESIEWQSDNFQVQGWVLPPGKIESGKRYPMIVLIHGGPAGMASPSWPSGRSLAPFFASRGYFVFSPNPRGSYGYGEEFTQANIQDFGGGDLRDIMKGVDAALARFPVDPERLGVTGWSYGGYMTMWTVTQTNRFKAAMAGAGIANWQSYYGQNLIDRWMMPYFGATVYDNPAVYAKSAPIEFIKRVKTPTLVIVGERDAECPAPQSFEFWHALRTLGTKTELVVYPGEGHMFMDPKNRTDMHDRTLKWFETYLR